MLRKLAAPILLVLIVTGFLWKITLTRSYTWLDSADLSYQWLPWMQFQARELHSGHLPLWDPHHWGGQSLVGQVQPGITYPVNWFLLAAPLRDGKIRPGILDAYFVLIRFMGALFAYLLCRDLGRSRAASLLAGVLYGLGSFIGASAFPNFSSGAVWLPLVFLFLLRVAGGRKPWSSAALSGVVCGVAFLSGHHLVPCLTLLVTAAVWLYLIFRSWRPDWRMAGLAAVSLVFTLAVGAVQILPAYEYGKQAIRWVGAPEAITWNQRVPYSVHEEFSLGVSSLPGLIIPGILKHANPFVGVTALSLALLGLVAGWSNRYVRLFGAVALGGLLFSLGKDNIFHGMLYAVIPVLEKVREPALAIFIFHFGIAGLVACGIDQLRNGSGWNLRFSIGLAVFGCLLVISSVFFAQWNKNQALLDGWGMLTGITSLLLAGVFRGHLSPRALAVCLLGLLVLDLGNGSRPPFREKAAATIVPRLSQHADVINFLARQPKPFRVEVDDQEIPYNLGDWKGFDDMGGYFPTLPLNVWRMGRMANRNKLYGVTYSVNRGAPYGAQQLVYESPSGLKVYRNPDVFPRVWSVHNIVSAIPDVLVDTRLDFLKTAFLTQPAPPLDTCAGDDRTRFAERTPSRLTIDAEMSCRGMVVVSENYAPGWRATVDGRPAEIFPAYFSMRGVVVPAGRHRIEMTYRPMSVYLGAMISTFGLLGAAFLAFRDRHAKC